MKINLDCHQMLSNAHRDITSRRQIRCEAKRINLRCVTKPLEYADTISIRSIRVPSNAMFERIQHSRSIVSQQIKKTDITINGSHYKLRRIESSLQAFFDKARLLKKHDIIYCSYSYDGVEYTGADTDISVHDGVFFVVESLTSSEKSPMDNHSEEDDKKTFLVQRHRTSLTLLGSRSSKLPRLPLRPIPLPIRLCDIRDTDNVERNDNADYRTVPWYDLKAASKLINLLLPLTVDNDSRFHNFMPHLRIAVLLSGMPGSGRRSIVRSVSAMLGLNVIIISGHDILRTSSKTGDNVDKNHPDLHQRDDYQTDGKKAINQDVEVPKRIVDVNQNLRDSFERAADFSPAVLLVTDFQILSKSNDLNSFHARGDNAKVDDDDDHALEGTRFYEVLKCCTEKHFMTGKIRCNNVVLIASVTEGDMVADEVRRCFTHEVTFRQK